MASGGPRQFDDSSGPISDTPNKSQQQRRPEPIELKEMRTAQSHRDSGCFTGSPMTAYGSGGQSFSPSRNDSFFVFESPTDSPGSIRQPFVAYAAHSTPTASSAPGDMPDMESDDDDVFHSSEDSLIDSGIQTTSGRAEHLARRTVGRPAAVVYRQDEQDVESDSDESSTGSEEFSTAELGVDADGAVSTSSPIDIPPRSRDSSPTDADDEGGDGSTRPRFAVGCDEQTPPQRLQRRATLALINMEGHRGHRPGVIGRAQTFSQSMDGTRGPLPDVVPHGLRRTRAMSESAIYSSRRVGTSLRQMSDEFNDITLNRQRNLNMIQLRQRNPDHVRQGNSLKPTSSPRRVSFLSSIQRKLFSSSQE